jgi:uncharacterized protein
MTPESPFPWFHPLLIKLRAHLASEPFPRDAAHDLGHILRVARLAEALAHEEKASVEVCVAAALLHDLVYRPKNHPESPLTARLAADLVPQWCQATPGLETKADTIAAAVATHSWSGGQAPGSLEAAVLQDADRLEALGAIGIARVFATGASFGAGLWHPEDPWADGRDLDDKAWSLDHFERKLLKLAAGMTTAAGRRRSAARQQVMTAYLDALRAELDPAPTADS